MLNAMPMPTAPPEIHAGPVKADVCRAGGRQCDAGSQDAESFASTLESIHKTEAAAHKTSNPVRDETSPGSKEAESQSNEDPHADKAATPENPVEAVVTNPLMPVNLSEGKPGARDVKKGLSELQQIMTTTDDKMTVAAAEPEMGGGTKDQQKINAKGTPRLTIVVAEAQTEEGATPGAGAETVAAQAVNTASTSADTNQAGKRAGDAKTHAPAGNMPPPENFSAQVEAGGKPTPKTRQAVADATVLQNEGAGGGPAEKSEIEAGKRFANALGGQVRSLNPQKGTQEAESEATSPRGNTIDGQERTVRPSPSAGTGVGKAATSVETGHDALSKMAAAEEIGPTSGRPAATDAVMPLTTGSTIGKTTAAPSSPVAPSVHASAEAFQPDNFNNLVEKALFTVRGGQSEARIALKPDQLGHVHMKIATENHIVTVKIVTESPVARDLIDANANQLRAELQQQGLNVESIEVSVSDDQRDAYRGARQRETFLRNLASNGKPPHEEESPAPWEQRPGPSKTNMFGAAGIDYFA